MKSELHLLARTSSAPNEPDTFTAHCGYTSTDRKEFTAGVKAGCVECRHKAGWGEEVRE